MGWKRPETDQWSIAEGTQRMVQAKHRLQSDLHRLVRKTVEFYNSKKHRFVCIGVFILLWTLSLSALSGIVVSWPEFFSGKSICSKFPSFSSASCISRCIVVDSSRCDVVEYVLWIKNQTTRSRQPKTQSMMLLLFFCLCQPATVMICLQLPS